jgi:hypothetical protein
MPYFYFDLVIGREYRDQGGMILEDQALAEDRADSLAAELAILRPDLKRRGCAVRVVSDENHELYRSPLDPVPAWKVLRRSA